MATRLARRRWAVVWFALLIGGGVALVWGRLSKPPELSVLTREQWRKDLRYLARELPKRHKNAFHRITPEQFERAVRELDGDIAFLPWTAIVVRIRKITAMIGDGHTRLHLPISFHIYPLELYWFGDELRVIRTTPIHRRILGAQVVKIDHMPIHEANVKVYPLIPQGENKWFFLKVSAELLSISEVLDATGITRGASPAQFTFQDDTGNQVTLGMSPVERDAAADWLTPFLESPLYLQKPNEEFWFTTLPQSEQTVYVAFRKYLRLLASCSIISIAIRPTA